MRFVVLLALLVSISVPAPAFAAGVHVLQLEGPLDEGAAAWIVRATGRAEAEGADALVLVVDSRGGDWTAAARAAAALRSTAVPTWALVDGCAVGPALLPVLAAGEVWMTPGARLGALDGGPAEARVAEAILRELAEAAGASGRDADIARAMVDPEAWAAARAFGDGPLVLDAPAAVAHGYATGTVDGLEALLFAKDARIHARETGPGLVVRIAAALNSGLVVALLLCVGLLGLVVELKTPGLGLGGLAALLGFGLFAFSQIVLGGTLLPAGLVLLGAVLFVVELVVLPGTTLAGIAGLVAILGGLFLASVGDPAFADTRALWAAGRNVALAVLLIVGGIALVLRYLPGSRPAGKLVLGARLERNDRPAPDDATYRKWKDTDPGGSLLRARGVVVTDLKPTGTARFGEVVVEVVSTGGYLPAGTEVEVIEENANGRRVRPISAEEEEEEA